MISRELRIILFTTLLAALACFNGCIDNFPSSAPGTIVVRDTTRTNVVSWTFLNSHTGQTLRTVDFATPALGVIGGNAGTLIVTYDSGRTWTKMIVPPTSDIYGAHFFDSQFGLFVSDDSNIYRTSNAGQSWSRFYTGINGRGLYFRDRLNGFVLSNYSGPFGGTLWITTDGDATWVSADTQIIAGMHALAFSTPAHGVAVGSFGDIRHSEDGGHSWVQIAKAPVNVANFTSIVFLSANLGYCAGSSVDSNVGVIYRTTDGGTTWSLADTCTGGLNSIAFNGQKELTAVGDNGAVVQSTDAGITWTKLSFAFSNWRGVTYTSLTRLFLVGDNGQIAKRE